MSATSIISFGGLGPGLYQVAGPDEVQAVPASVTLREEDHFWLESKRTKSGDEWRTEKIGLHAATPALLLQAAAIGAHAHSEVVELDRQRIRVVATGYILHASGMLEVIERSKEYDLSAELMKAALKEVRSRDNKPDEAQREQQTVALVKTATEETALALVGTLPQAVKARVMEARLEVQTHREALCRTKAENQVLRYFIQQAGGVLKAKPGCGSVTVPLTGYVLKRRLSSSQVQRMADSLYGGGAPVETVESELVGEGDEHEVLNQEGADRAEQDVGHEEGEQPTPAEQPGPWDVDVTPEPAPEPTPEPEPWTMERAKARAAELWAKAEPLGVRDKLPKLARNSGLDALVTWIAAAELVVRAAEGGPA